MSDRQLCIYNGLLKYYLSGVCWVEMHKLANRVMLSHLTKNGILRGNVDEMMEVCFAY